MHSKIFIIFVCVSFVSTYIIPAETGANDWGSFDEHFPSTIKPFKGDEQSKLTLPEKLGNDQNNQKTIIGNTDALIATLGKSQIIVTAAYRVANYTPDLHSNEHAQFWKHEVIPNLLESLKQDVKARHVIIRSFSTIADLSITMQKSAEIVIKSQGSKKAVEIARSNIPAALKDLDLSITESSGLDNIAIKRFSNQTDQLLTIIGPEGANFVAQYSFYQKQLNELHQIQEGVFRNIIEKQGEAARLNNMIISVESRMNVTQKDIAETNARIKELTNLNDNLEKKIQDIPATVQKQIITHSSGGWWFWRHHEEHVETIQIPNPNKEIDTAYFNRTIEARVNRIKGISTDNEAKAKIKAALDKDLSELKGNYTVTLSNLTALKNELSDIISTSQEHINNITEKMKEIDKTEKRVNGMTGLSGQVLIDCLASVKAFAQTLGKGTTVYSPLISILNAIKSLVKQDVQLLEGDENDVFIAVNNMLENVKFLSKYSADAGKVLEATIQYKQILNSFQINTDHLEFLD